MRYRECKVQAGLDAKEALTPILLQEGVEGCVFKDDDDGLLCIFYLEEKPGWEQVWKRIGEKIAALKEYGFTVEPFLYTPRSIDSCTWEKLIEQEVNPRQIHPGIWIVPPNYRGEVAKDGWIIRLKTGQAFGTGTHPSTSLALGLIYDSFRGLNTVIDIGCGSGILSIAAALGGASRVMAVDRSQDAVLLARENVRLNGLQDRIQVIEADLYEGLPGNYEGIIINILLDQARYLFPRLREFAVDNALVIVSGILFNQMEELKRSVQESSLSIMDKRVKEEWVAFLLELRS